MDFVLVADKKFVFPVKNQRNLSFFFDISLGSDGKIRQRPIFGKKIYSKCVYCFDTQTTLPLKSILKKSPFSPRYLNFSPTLG